MSGGRPNRISLGTKFGLLTLSSVVNSRSKTKHIVGRWNCDCGGTLDWPLSRVKTAAKIDCGCLTHNRRRLGGITHGMKGTKTYNSWQSMLGRCLRPQDKDFYKYGARGITVCKRWLSFENFFADMGTRPEGTTIDRWPNPAGNYKPGNCRWATALEQGRNRRIKLKLVKGPLGVLPVSDYAQGLGISAGCLYQRMKRGRLAEDCSWAG